MKLHAVLSTTDQINTEMSSDGSVRLSCLKYFAASTAVMGMDKVGGAKEASPMMP